VIRGRLPQRAGLPGLNGGGTAAVVPPDEGIEEDTYRGFNNNKHVHKNLMHEIINQKECRLLEVKCTASSE